MEINICGFQNCHRLAHRLLSNDDWMEMRFSPAGCFVYNFFVFLYIRKGRNKAIKGGQMLNQMTGNGRYMGI